MKKYSFLPLLKSFAAALILAATTGNASAAAPEIAIDDASSANIADGDTASFGSVNVGTNSSLTFTIKNIGNADLTGLNITKSGANSADFTITSEADPQNGASVLAMEVEVQGC